MKPTLSTALTLAALLLTPMAVTACDQKTETKETKKESTTTTAPTTAPAPDQSTTTTTTTTDKKD
jgi:hypothetical protein